MNYFVMNSLLVLCFLCFIKGYFMKNIVDIHDRYELNVQNIVKELGEIQ